MEIEVITQLGIAGALCVYIWNDAKKRNEKTETKVEVSKEKIDLLEKRVQKIEDVQGNQLDTLTKDLKEFKYDVNSKLDALKVMIHKDKNMEGQLNTTLGLLLKELTKHHDE